jgi:hypothetical protein
MTRPKRRNPMGRTMIIIDKETKKLWTHAAKINEMSNSEYFRKLIKKYVPDTLNGELKHDNA